ncbi:MAG: putative S-layer protein [Nanoarchaeota archaeon]
MNNKLLSLVTLTILTILALSAFASATGDLILTSASSSITANAASTGDFEDISLNFQLNNTHLTDSLLISWSNTTSNPNVSWKSVPSDSSIGNNSVINVIGIISIAKNTLPAPYTLTLTASNGSSNVGSKTVTIVVPTVNSLAFVDISSNTIEYGKSVTFKIKNNGNTNSPIYLTKFGNVTLSSSEIISLAGGRTSPLITLNYTGSDLASSAVVTASQNSYSTNYTFSALKGVCRLGTHGSNLSVSIDDITNNGDDDTIWKPLDEVTVKVNVENIGIDDIKNVNIRLYLLDETSGSNIADDLSFISEGDDEIEISKINDGDEETLEFEFKVPADIDFGDYNLIVKATSDKQSEDTLCDETSGEPITIEAESDEEKYLSFDNINLVPNEASCGDTISLSFNVANIGEEDQDRVKVTLYSRELGIDLSKEITGGLDQGDQEPMSFEFTIPSNLVDKSYRISLNAEYDYRSGTYRQALADSYDISYKVFGCSASNVTNATSISVSQDSEAVAGEDLATSIVVRNTLSTSNNFVIDVRGYSDWATFTSISERAFTLGAGESKTVQLVLTSNDDAKGEQSFVIDVQSNGKSQLKTVAVEFPGSSIFSIFGNNQLAWIIGLVNVILIILIIIVAVRVSRN